MSNREEKLAEAALTALILSGKGISENPTQRTKEVNAAHHAALDVLRIVMGDDAPGQAGEVAHLTKRNEELRQQLQASGIDLEAANAKVRELTKTVADGETAVRAAKAVIEERAEDVQRTPESDTRKGGGKAR
jgi:uncharacterized ferritin-like protein (DUF455 family)